MACNWKHKILTYIDIQIEEIMKKVAFIMGSDSDLPIVEKGINMLDSLDVFTRKHCENVANLTCRICKY